MTAASAAAAAAPPPVVVGAFGEDGSPVGGLPAGWKELRFRRVARPTRYALVREGEDVFLRAVSSASASALYREVSPDLAETPVLSWRWRVRGSVPSADARRRSGDDYAARVYVAFAYDPARAGAWERAKRALGRALYGAEPPGSALNYVWDNRLPLGAELDNAYTDRAKMVVLASGDAQAGRWLGESRDVLEDYRRLFGQDPPPVLFVAVMTDTDDTGESASADYDDIAFRGAP